MDITKQSVQYQYNQENQPISHLVTFSNFKILSIFKLSNNPILSCSAQTTLPALPSKEINIKIKESFYV